jgi:hypothetical protein
MYFFHYSLMDEFERSIPLIQSYGSKKENLPILQIKNNEMSQSDKFEHHLY